MRVIVVALLALAFLAPAAAQAADPSETLVMAPYPGPPDWKEVTNETHDGSWIRERIPEGQDLDTYKDIITYQGFANRAGADPAAVLRDVFAGFGGACAKVSVNGPTSRREGGYPVAYAQVYCSQQNGQAFGVVIFYKAVAGTNALYVVDRDFRVPPSPVAGQLGFPKGEEAEAKALPNAQAAANKYLETGVYLCGAASTDRRCPH